MVDTCCAQHVHDEFRTTIEVRQPFFFWQRPYSRFLLHPTQMGASASFLFFFSSPFHPTQMGGSASFSFYYNCSLLFFHRYCVHLNSWEGLSSSTKKAFDIRRSLEIICMGLAFLDVNRGALRSATLFTCMGYLRRSVVSSVFFRGFLFLLMWTSVLRRKCLVLLGLGRRICTYMYIGYKRQNGGKCQGYIDRSRESEREREHARARWGRDMIV